MPINDYCAHPIGFLTAFLGQELITVQVLSRYPKQAHFNHFPSRLIVESYEFLITEEESSIFFLKKSHAIHLLSLFFPCSW